jgi:hypothetical protein
MVFALVCIPGTSTSKDYVLPPQNYRHWTILKKICESGRSTYGANEFVENGQICRWTFVPYWPDNKPPVK